MNQNFTQSVLSILQQSQQNALSLHHQQLSSFHILKSILNNADQHIIYKCLQKIDQNKLKDLCAKKLSQLPEVFGSQNLSLSPELSVVFQKMDKRAAELGDKYIGLDNFVFCILSSEPVKLLFMDCGGSLESLENAIRGIRMNKTVDTENAESGFDALNRYAKDITQLASAGKLDPVIGRDEEIRRTLHVLSRRTKNNPILIGEPGVGKTAIAE